MVFGLSVGGTGELEERLELRASGRGSGINRGHVGGGREVLRRGGVGRGGSEEEGGRGQRRSEYLGNIVRRIETVVREQAGNNASHNAIKVLNEFRPDSINVRHLSRIFRFRRNPQCIQLIMHWMQLSKIPLKSSDFNDLIMAYAACGNPAAAFQTFETMMRYVEPDGEVVLTVLRIYQSLGQWERMYEFFQDAEWKFGIEIEAEHYSVVISTLAEHKQLKLALKVLKEAEDTQPEVLSEGMFNFLLRCLDTENQHKRYLRTFYHALEMYPLSKVEFLTAIRMKKALGDNRGAEHIQRYLSSCDRKYHVELLPGNHVGYGPWDGFSLASPTPEPTRPVPPSEPMQTLTMDEVYSQAAELDWSGEKRRIGLKFTGVEPAGSPSPPETPVVTASSSKMSQLSKQPSEEKESSDTNSDSGSDTDFLGLAATPPPSVAVGDVDTVAESLRRPRTNIFKVLASFLDAGSGASQLKEVLRRVKGTGFGQVAFRALKVIREQNRELLDGEVYNLVLYFLGKNGRSSDGLSVIEWMTEDGFKPSLISCSLLINSTSHTGDWETAARVLSAMRKAQTPPNPQVLHCLINAYKSGGQWDKALAVFFKMRMLRMEVSETLGTELRAGKTAAENAMHVDPES